MWNWRAIKTGSLAVLDPAMTDLQNELQVSAKTHPVQARAKTADATVTTLYTAVCPVDTTTLVSGFVIARRTGGVAGAANDGAGYRVEFVAKNTSGTAALIGAGSVTVLGESVAGWDCTLSASGGTIRVRVTGAADTNVQWRWSGKTLAVKE
jgi:hypothetical protein